MSRDALYVPCTGLPNGNKRFGVDRDHQRIHAEPANTCIRQHGFTAGGVTRRQVWNDVVSPFLATRIVLLFISWVASFFPVSRPIIRCKDVLARGWQFSPYRLLDIWGRWDTGWYMSIVHDGYMAARRLHAATKQSHLFSALSLSWYVLCSGLSPTGGKRMASCF